MRSLALLVLFASFASELHAQSAARREEIYNAVRAFGDALETGDADKLTAAIWISDGSFADTQGRDAFVRLVVAEKRLERTAAAQFGAAGGARFRCNFSLIHTPEERSALSMAEITLDTDMPGGARVQKVGETYSIRLRRGPVAAGEPWQVVVDVVEMLQDDNPLVPTKPADESRVRIERYEAMAAAVAEVAAGVEKGDYANALAAETELISRFERVLQEYITKLNALPGRRGSWRWYR